MWLGVSQRFGQSFYTELGPIFLFSEFCFCTLLCFPEFPPKFCPLICQSSKIVAFHIATHDPSGACSQAKCLKTGDWPHAVSFYQMSTPLQYLPAFVEFSVSQVVVFIFCLEFIVVICGYVNPIEDTRPSYDIFFYTYNLLRNFAFVSISELALQILSFILLTSPSIYIRIWLDSYVSTTAAQFCYPHASLDYLSSQLIASLLLPLSLWVFPKHRSQTVPSHASVQNLQCLPIGFRVKTRFQTVAYRVLQDSTLIAFLTSSPIHLLLANFTPQWWPSCSSSSMPGALPPYGVFICHFFCLPYYVSGYLLQVSAKCHFLNDDQTGPPCLKLQHLEFLIPITCSIFSFLHITSTF